MSELGTCRKRVLGAVWRGGDSLDGFRLSEFDFGHFQVAFSGRCDDDDFVVDFFSDEGGARISLMEHRMTTRGLMLRAASRPAVNSGSSILRPKGKSSVIKTSGRNLLTVSTMMFRLASITWGEAWSPC